MTFLLLFYFGRVAVGFPRGRGGEGTVAVTLLLNYKSIRDFSSAASHSVQGHPDYTRLKCACMQTDLRGGWLTEKRGAVAGWISIEL